MDWYFDGQPLLLASMPNASVTQNIGPDFRPGRDISSDEMDSRIAISQEGQPTFYLGHLGLSQGVPYLYMLPKDRRDSRRFVVLRHGGLFLEGFLFDNKYYKILED